MCGGDTVSHRRRGCVTGSTQTDTLTLVLLVYV